MTTTADFLVPDLVGCHRELQKVVFPPLDLAGPGRPARDRAYWSIRFYVNPLLLHASQLLGAFILVFDAKQTAAAFVLARALFELAAHATLVRQKTARHVEAEDYPTVLKELARASFGDRKPANVGRGPVLVQFHIMDAVRCLDELLEKYGFEEKRAQQLYGCLSDFSHPNSDTFMQHYSLSQTAESGAPSQFAWVPDGDPFIPTVAVRLALMVTLQLSIEWLDLVGDGERATAVRAAQTALTGHEVLT